MNHQIKIVRYVKQIYYIQHPIDKYSKSTKRKIRNANYIKRNQSPKSNNTHRDEIIDLINYLIVSI